MDNFFSSMLDKVNDVLFEVLGLLLPSLLLCIVLAEPLFYLQTVSWKVIPMNYITELLKGMNQFWLTVFVIAVFYISGNVIKVVSKLYYALGKAIFDNTIFKLIKWIVEKIKKQKHKKTKKIKDTENSSKKKLRDRPFFAIINVVYIWIKNTLSFTTVSYGNNFDKTYVYLAKEKLKIFDDEKDKNKNWYLFYKEATTILNQHNISTLYYKHLSKYNSFRSLECVFFCGIIYNMFFCIQI